MYNKSERCFVEIIYCFIEYDKILIVLLSLINKDHILWTIFGTENGRP